MHSRLDENSPQLIKNSILAEEFSSAVHPIELFCDESRGHCAADCGGIVNTYSWLKLVLLPINSESLYVYWSLSDLYVPNPNERYRLCIYEHGYETWEKNELITLNIEGSCGSKYVKIDPPQRKVFCSIVQNDIYGNQLEMLCSKSVSMPSDDLRLGNSEVWMRKREEWMRLLQASMAQIPVSRSSLSLVRQSEALRKYHFSMSEEYQTNDPTFR